MVSGYFAGASTVLSAYAQMDDWNCHKRWGLLSVPQGREHWNPERLVTLLEVTLDRLKDTAIVQTWFEGISKGSKAYGDNGRGGARNLPESGPV